ncbi:MAG: microcin C transport system substrate-binding protein [Gammaproteobacteria bacterium]|jgi:microcin C transport system substrate-binding protein
MFRKFIYPSILVIVFSTSGCEEEPKSDESKQITATKNNATEVQEYYADNPEFFGFKTMDDLPEDLIWEKGNKVAEFASPDAIQGGTQYGAIQDFPRTLRHVGPDSNGSFRTWILDDVGMSLAHTHPNNKDALFPGLATEWAISPETKTTYVKLNPEARWSDGTQVTADDYLFSFFFFQSSYIVAPWYNNWFGTMYTNITRYDDYTISISIPAVKPDMAIRTLDMRPTPSHFYRELGDDYVERYQWKFVPTTGAYEIKPDHIKKGRSITLTRVKDWWANDLPYWRNRYNAERIVLSVIRDSAKSFEAFLRGDLDMQGLNLSDYWYEKLPNDHELVSKGYVQKKVFFNQHPRPTYGLWINSSKFLLDKTAVRIGINHATNWDLVIEQYFRGDYERLQTTADGYGEFTNLTIKARSYDIQLALDSFKKAGFDRRGDDGILINTKGQRLSFTLTTGYEVMKDVLTILKQEAKRAGLEFRIEILDGTASWKKAQEKKHDILFSAFGVGLEMYPRYWETYHSVNAYDQAFLEDGSINPDRKVKTQSNNLELVADLNIDKMIDRYRSSSNKAEMIKLAHNLDNALYDHASFSPGFKQSYYRIGHWRWLKFPKGFNLKHSRLASEYFIHWVDNQARTETLEAKSENRSYPPSIAVFDQYRDE